MFRGFFLGFVPTICFWGLAAGLSLAWLNTQRVLTPAAVPVTLKAEESGGYTLKAFSQEVALPAPSLPDRLEIFSRYPVLVPRWVRLAAWGLEELPSWKEYLKGVIRY